MDTKQYELKDHLGNIRVAIGDMKIPTGTRGVAPFVVDEKSVSDFYPGGMAISDRSWQVSNYRYGYNKGSEIDKEIFAGEGRAFSTLYREGDTYSLRWWSADPKANEQPWQSSYSYMDGNPIWKNDPLGDMGPIVGAVIGGSVELGSQITGSLIAQKSYSFSAFKTAFNKVDWSDVAVSTALGAVTGGLSALEKKVVMEVAIEAVASATENYIKENTGTDINPKYNYTNTFIDGFTGGLFAKIKVNALKSYQSNSQVSKNLYKEAKKLSKKAINRNRNASIKRSEEAMLKARESGSNVTEIKTKPIEETVNKTLNKLDDKAKSEIPQQNNQDNNAQTGGTKEQENPIKK